MTRLSARGTYLAKRIIPVAWYGLLLLIVAVGSNTAIRKGKPEELYFFIPFAIFFAGVSFIAFKKLIFELVDSVWDDGDALVIRSGRKQERVLLSDILSVSYAGFQNPSRVTLYLRRPTVLGDEIPFAIKTRTIGFRLPALVRDLMERVDEARRSAQPSAAQ